MISELYLIGTYNNGVFTPAHRAKNQLAVYVDRRQAIKQIQRRQENNWYIRTFVMDEDKKVQKMKQTGIYSMYRGEENLGEGTIPELAQRAGVKESTLNWYLSPTHLKRSNKQKKHNKTITLIRWDKNE